MPFDLPDARSGEAKPLASLSRAERLVVGSLRRYAAEGRRAETLAPIFRDVFGLAGVEPALAAFVALVAILERHRRGAAIVALRRDRASPVEQDVLRLLAAVQTGDRTEADAATSDLILKSGWTELQQAARRFVASLDEADLHLPAALRKRPRAARARLMSAPGVHQVSDLTADERLVLSGIRAWVGRIKQNECGWPALFAIFAAHGAGRAAASLHALLYALSVATRRSIDVRCAACPSLSPDEARMLHAVACAQQDRMAESFDLLLTWVPAAAARLTIDAVDGLARLLLEAQAVLAVRAWDFARLESLALPPPDGESAGRVLH